VVRARDIADTTRNLQSFFLHSARMSSDPSPPLAKANLLQFAVLTEGIMPSKKTKAKGEAASSEPTPKPTVRHDIQTKESPIGMHR
jgi:hypothetical protein